MTKFANSVDALLAFSEIQGDAGFTSSADMPLLDEHRATLAKVSRYLDAESAHLNISDFARLLWSAVDSGSIGRDSEPLKGGLWILHEYAALAARCDFARSQSEYYLAIDAQENAASGANTDGAEIDDSETTDRAGQPYAKG